MLILGYYHLPRDIDCYYIDKIPEGTLVIKSKPESWFPNYSLQKVIFTKEVDNWKFRFYKECKDKFGYILHPGQIIEAICSNKYIEIEYYSRHGIKDIILNITKGEVYRK